jgi:hypothetical protein
MTRKRTWGVALRAAGGALAASLLLGGTAVARRTPFQATVRLEGQFQMDGQVTAARHVLGEQVGQMVVRTWTFTPTCVAGPCAQVALTRQRAAGSDNLVLNLTAANLYTGTGVFYAPLRCAGRPIAHGESVPFKVTVQITGTTLEGAVPVATQVHATYADLGRRNLTRCVAVPGHDAAVYSGVRVS